MTWDPANFRADLVLSNNSMLMDGGLTSAVILSLFLDRQASPDDPLPDTGVPGMVADRRGYWGDTPAASAPVPAGTTPDLIGSRLWLLYRALQTTETLRRAQLYCQEALAWMIDDGVAARIDVTCAWAGLRRMSINVQIYRQSSPAVQPDHSFDFAWNNIAVNP